MSKYQKSIDRVRSEFSDPHIGFVAFPVKPNFSVRAFEKRLNRNTRYRVFQFFGRVVVIR